ncbi:MAG: hypothetical protein QGI45_03260 [Myxococcota bacterium]|nr:hypothetical protein [Myxococcota bacterium]
MSFLETAELEECKSDAKNIMDQAAAAEQLSNNALVQRCDAYANTTSSMTCEEFNNLYAADSNSDSNSSGSGNSGTGYTSDDISKCCNCLVDAVWSEWSDGSNKKYCFESEASQCISALEHGSSITMLSPRCTGQYCAGDCWFLR